MSRPLRIEFNDAWYHVMNRGTAHKNIFHSGSDQEYFLDLLEKIYDKFKIETHAYCLMSNHYHLLLKTPLGNLNKAMRYLNSLYAQKFNYRYNIDGPLFRGRYKAILVSCDEYLLRVSRYIHLNPVEAGICKFAKDYKWSSYKYYAGLKIKPKWLYNDEVLNFFNEDEKHNKYINYVEEDHDNELKIFYQKSYKLPILGSKTFIKEIRDKYLKNKSITREITEKIIVKKLFIPTITDIINLISSIYHVDIDSIRITQPKKTNLPRSIFVYLVVKHTQVSYNEIGLFLGNVTRNAVTNIYLKILKTIKNDNSLKLQIEELECQLFNI